MRIHYLFFFFVLATILFLIFWQEKPVPLIVQEFKPINSTNQILINLNEKNKKIQSFSSKLIVESQGIKLNSMIVYEKPSNFRMISNSFAGKELDVGSNFDFFWFWSKRMKPQALFYAKHQDFNRTRLRTPFNPAWIIQILGTGDIPECETYLYKGKLVFVEKMINNSQKIIFRMRMIDLDKMVCVGHFIFDEKMNPIISAEIQSFYLVDDVYLPKKINIFWYEENVRSVWTFEQPVINTAISTSMWQMPNYEPKINLKDY